jgi:hypothetical protein
MVKIEGRGWGGGRERERERNFRILLKKNGPCALLGSSKDRILGLATLRDRVSEPAFFFSALEIESRA